MYALRWDTKQIADFAVGTRTVKTLKKVIDTVLLSGAEKVCTDKPHLFYIIPPNIYQSKSHSTATLKERI